MAVAQLDLKREYNHFRIEIDRALAKVLKSGHFILGEEVRALEEEVAAYCGAAYGIGVSSGTDALYLTLRALGIGPGDEVILPSFTFVATAEAVAYCGATPFFVDVDLQTYNLDPNKIEDALTPRTKAIIPVHLFGLPAPMESLRELAKRYSLLLIEDAAQAFGAIYKEKRVGSLGDAACFSFFPTKNLNAYGDGGMVVTSREEVKERIKALRGHGSRERYIHREIGYNSRLDEIQAAILRVKLPHIDCLNEKRREVAYSYSQALQGVVKVPMEPLGSYHVYHQYTIGTKVRDRLREHLERQGIDCQVYYPVPLHWQEPFKGCPKGDMEGTERASQEVLSLPIHPFLSSKEVEEVIEGVLSFF